MFLVIHLQLFLDIIASIIFIVTVACAVTPSVGFSWWFLGNIGQFLSRQEENSNMKTVKSPRLI